MSDDVKYVPDRVLHKLQRVQSGAAYRYLTQDSDGWIKLHTKMPELIEGESDECQYTWYSRDRILICCDSTVTFPDLASTIIDLENYK